MGEISELLVAGGYFRARIKGLHNFDKVRSAIVVKKITQTWFFLSDYRWNVLGNTNVQC